MKNLILMILIGSSIVLSTSQCSNSTVEREAKTDNPVTKTTPKKIDATGKMPWVSLNDVEALVQKNPKKIIVDVYTPWCGPCKMMDRNTFSNPEIIKQMGDNFYPIKFNAEGPEPITFMGKEYKNPKFDPNRTRGRNSQHQLSGFFAVRGYPSLVILDEQLKILGKIVGYKTPEQLKAELSKYMN